MRQITTSFVVLSISLVAQELTPQQEYQKLATRLFRKLPSSSASRIPDAVEGGYLSSEEVGRHVGRLHDIATNAIARGLSTNPSAPTKVALRAIDELQGDLSGRDDELGTGRLPSAYATKLGGSDVLIVGFAVLHGPLAMPAPTPYMQFYLKTANGWQLKAEAPPELDGFALQIAVLPTPVTNEVWLLAWGKRYGDNSGRLYARLFAFDGSRVRTIWSRDELSGGRLKLEDNHVILTHREDVSDGAKPITVREDLYVTFNGLQ